MFLGTYEPKLDEKGRVILPAKFREELSSGLVLTRGQELKLVYPQSHADGDPARFASLHFEHFFLQPLDTGDPETREANVRSAVAYCLAHPRWRLSLQTHKLLDIR